MKNFKGFSLLFVALAAFMFTSFMSYASPDRAKHPPGAYIALSYCDVQPENTVVLAGHSNVYPDYAIQSNRQWIPGNLFIGYINTKTGKALPKTAIQRMYGINDPGWQRQKLV